VTKGRGLRQRILTGEPLVGTLHDISDPGLVELVGYAGFDFVMLDYEHGIRSLETIQHCLRAAEAAGIAALVRVGTTDQSLISRIFEAGAAGIVVAHIKTAAEAEAIVAAARYAPEGVRGEGYARQGALYKLDRPRRPVHERANEEAVVIAVVEDPEGIENIEAILEVDGLTGVAPGQADLAAALGGIAMDADEVNVLMTRVRDAVRARDDRCMMGLLVSPEAAPRLVQEGTQLLLCNHDVILIGDLYERILLDTKSSLGAAESERAKA
jgi:2-keto-3-deoxy-L-rhamnonate aldolase RhmA